MLSNLSKAFKNIIYNGVQNFCQTLNFFARNQFGFRKNRNTGLTAFNLLDKLIPALKEKKYDICIFLAYSAYFDTLSRSILYEKLEKYGIRGVILDLIEAYFRNRSTFVSYNAC